MGSLSAKRFPEFSHHALYPKVVLAHGREPVIVGFVMPEETYRHETYVEDMRCVMPALEENRPKAIKSVLSGLKLGKGRIGIDLGAYGGIVVLEYENLKKELPHAEFVDCADLMYRLRPIVLALPPLRERGGDVLVLARHFLRLAAQREGLAPPALPAEVARALAAYAWPGNVRELENEMNRLVVLAGRGPILRQHLSPRLSEPVADPRSPLRDARARFEREFVARALSRNGGNRTRTACELGVTRQALVSKIKRLGL